MEPGCLPVRPPLPSQVGGGGGAAQALVCPEEERGGEAGGQHPAGPGRWQDRGSALATLKRDGSCSNNPSDRELRPSVATFLNLIPGATAPPTLP